jgi:hypothetical protein
MISCRRLAIDCIGAADALRAVHERLKAMAATGDRAILDISDAVWCINLDADDLVSNLLIVAACLARHEGREEVTA